MVGAEMLLGRGLGLAGASLEGEASEGEALGLPFVPVEMLLVVLGAGGREEDWEVTPFTEGGRAEGGRL
jgi:hypothetical protein